MPAEPAEQLLCPVDRERSTKTHTKQQHTEIFACPAE
jgi:hypothetical protein